MCLLFHFFGGLLPPEIGKGSLRVGALEIGPDEDGKKLVGQEMLGDSVKSTPDGAPVSFGDSIDGTTDGMPVFLEGFKVEGVADFFLLMEQ
jgi:hypothetical protein